MRIYSKLASADHPKSMASSAFFYKMLTNLHLRVTELLATAIIVTYTSTARSVECHSARKPLASLKMVSHIVSSCKRLLEVAR